MADLGFNSYRFSIEWARIEPEEGHFSQAALDHYRRMLEACHAHDLKPVVTFHHFTSPRWVTAAGGWASEDTPEKFGRYCARATAELGDLIEYACTINEANIPRMVGLLFMSRQEADPNQFAFIQTAADAFGLAPDRLAPFLFSVTEQGRDVILAAHKQAVSAIKAERSKLPVGLTLALQDMQAVPRR